MKIVCSTLNSQFIHSSLAPWCLKAGIDAFCKKSHSVIVIESTINSSMTDFIQKIIAEQPDIIAFSCYIWNINKIIEVCKILSETVNSTICLGGPEVEYRAENILKKYSFVKYILLGEGEWSFSSLINNISSNFTLESVEGFCYLDNGKLIEIPPKIHIETPPSPYCNEYYAGLNGRIAYIEASRGCPYRCSYCLSGRISVYKTFEYNTIVNNIVSLSHSGTKTIKFVDRTFNANKHFSCRILEFINSNYGESIKDGVCFHFELSAEIIDDNFLNAVKKLPPGICQFEIGIQTYNENTLKIINRKCDLNKLEDSISKLIAINNAHIHIDLIAGLPGEDISSFISGFNRAFKLKSHMLQLGFLKVLHGSELRNNINSYNCRFRQDPPYEIISTDTLSENDINKLKKCEIAVDKLYNSGRFLYTIDYLLYSINISPFELMYQAGSIIDIENISLSEVVSKIYCYFSSQCNNTILKEKLLCDLAVIGANIKIPSELSIFDKRYKTIKKTVVEKIKSNAQIVIINSESKVFAVPQNSQKDLCGRKTPIIFDLYEIL